MSETLNPGAGLVRRLMAIVYDTLLLLGVAFAYGVIILLIRKLAGDDTLQPLTGVAAVIELFFLWLTLSGYYVLCWTKRGQTLGMKSWRLRLEKADGTYLNIKECWLRCVLALVSALPAGLGYLWCLWDRKNGCWHDRWSNSQVIVLAKEKKNKPASGSSA